MDAIFGLAMHIHKHILLKTQLTHLFNNTEKNVAV